MSVSKRMLEAALESIDTYASAGYDVSEIANLANMDVRIVEGFIEQYLPQHGELLNG